MQTLEAPLACKAMQVVSLESWAQHCSYGVDPLVIGGSQLLVVSKGKEFPETRGGGCVAPWYG